jgi:hypothetical protein
MRTPHPVKHLRSSRAARNAARATLAGAIALSAPSCAPEDHITHRDPVAAIVIPPGSPPVSVAGNFVGQLDGTSYPTLIAIHALEPDATGEREITVYICDSQVEGNIWWFRERVTGNDFSLVSLSGEATLNVRLTPGSAVGSLHSDLPRPLTFRVHRARPGEGIYTATIASNGKLTGGGWVGQGLVEGQYPGVGAEAIGTVQITLILPDGRRLNFSEPSWQPSAPGDYRAVIARIGPNLGVLGTSFLTTAVRPERTSSSDIIGLNVTK